MQQRTTAWSVRATARRTRRAFDGKMNKKRTIRILLLVVTLLIALAAGVWIVLAE
jgi:flagellar basal body-associated protein FliL